MVRHSHEHPTDVIIAINDRDPEAMDLHVLDIYTGKRTLLLRNDEKFLDVGFDEKGRIRYASRRTPDGGQAIYLFDAGAKDPAKKWKEWDRIPFEDAETAGPVGMIPRRDAMYFTESRGRDTAALVEIDLATKKQKVLAEDPRADITETIQHPTKHTIQAASSTYDRIRRHFLDRALKKDFDAMAQIDPLAVFGIASRTLDDKTWIVLQISDVGGVHYHVWDRARRKATPLFSLYPKLADRPLAKMHPVVIEARDGLELVAYLSLPRSADPEGDGKPNTRVPMVLNVHGGPWARDVWGFDRQHQWLTNRGYAVLSVNFRGSHGFGKKFLNAGNLQWGKAMHTDLLDAVAWAVEQGITANDQTCILGGSYGGYSTLAGLTMTPDVFTCGVDIVGPSNLLTLLGSLPPYWAPLLSQFYTRVGNPHTPEGKALLVAASPLTHVKNIRRPLLIGQGAHDPRVTQAESEQIVSAMKSHGLPVTYALFADEGHGFARPENDIAFNALTEAFLSAHLGGFYEPITSSELKNSSIQIKDGKEGIPGL